MVLSRIEIRDFQSLYSVELELGRFTVIIGPSNSGKSALLRAIRMVTANVDSPTGVVRHGAKSTSVLLTFEDGRVAIARGKARSEYQLGDEVYPKAGKTVPEAVEEFLRFAEVEGERLSFASQFDRPFLLSEPSTQVAKVFGDLTNVTVLYAAVREAVRRKLEVAGKLRTRRADLEASYVRAEEFLDVPAKARKIRSLRENFEQVAATGNEFERFRSHLNIVKIADQAIADLESKVVEVPDVNIGALDSRLAELTASHRQLAAVRRYDAEIPEIERSIEALSEMIERWDGEYHRTLTEAGTCPMCGQEVQNVKGVGVGAGG